MADRLKKGQVIFINNERYYIINMIEFEEDTWIWQEYEIVNEQGQHKWLSIEENENKVVEYWVYVRYYGGLKEQGLKLIANSEEFDLYEKGIAKVRHFYGNADVDLYEKCNFRDYISKDKKRIISIEQWDNETERTVGNLIENSKLRITDEIDAKMKKIQKQNKMAMTFLVALFLLFLVVPLALGLISEFTRNSIINYLEKATTKYTYVTSVTNNVDSSKKAKVYKSSLTTIDATVKDIIDGVPEGIKDTIDDNPNTNEDGIGLHTSDEFAFVYEENGAIYVQVSKKDYVDENGSTYHSRCRNYYYRSYTSKNRSTIYSTYSASARQNSINSRKSSGGGTSSGK